MFENKSSPWLSTLFAVSGSGRARTAVAYDYTNYVAGTPCKGCGTAIVCFPGDFSYVARMSSMR